MGDRGGHRGQGKGLRSVQGVDRVRVGPQAGIAPEVDETLQDDDGRRFEGQQPRWAAGQRLSVRVWPVAYV